MGGVTSNPPVGEPEQEWQQPPFQPDKGFSTSAPSPVASGSVILPREQRLPPSATESMLRTLNGLIWLAFFVGVVTGVLDWWLGIFITLGATIVLSNVRRHLRQRRKALSRRVVPPEEQNGLR